MIQTQRIFIHSLYNIIIICDGPVFMETVTYTCTCMYVHTHMGQRKHFSNVIVDTNLMHLNLKSD